MRAYYDFQETSKVVGKSLLSRESWDALRTADNADFSIPETREAWLASFADRTDLRDRARMIAQLCRDKSLTSIFSAGVGGAGLEYFIKTENPDLYITCADFAPTATARLAGVFTECAEVIVFDMRRDEWTGASGTLYLLHRVDTELSDAAWRTCFARMASARVSPVLVVATAFLDRGKMIRIVRTYMSHRLRGRPLTFSGYIRTKRAFRALWKRDYCTEAELEMGDLTGFLIRQKP